MNRILFIGGPGNISRHVIREMISSSREVAVFTLPEVVRQQRDSNILYYPGDRNDTESLQKAISDFRPDILADFVCFTPRQAEGLYRIIRGKISQLLFVSTCDVYGYPLSHLPMDEDDPPGRPVGEYALNKKRCEDFYFEKEREEQLPLTIVRPSYSFGANFLLSFLAMDATGVLDRLKAGLPVFVPGDGTTLMQGGPAVNTGRMIAEILKHPDISIGKAYTLGHRTAMTHDEYITLLAEALDTKPVIRHIPSDFLYRFFREDTHNSMLHVLFRFNVAFSLKAFRHDFPDFEWVSSPGEAVRKYLDQHPVTGGTGDVLEDKVITLWDRMIEETDKDTTMINETNKE